MSPTNDYGGVAEAARFQPMRSVTNTSYEQSQENESVTITLFKKIPAAGHLYALRKLSKEIRLPKASGSAQQE